MSIERAAPEPVPALGPLCTRAREGRARCHAIRVSRAVQRLKRVSSRRFIRARGLPLLELARVHDRARGEQTGSATPRLRALARAPHRAYVALVRALPPAVAAHLESLFPGSRVTSARRLGDDAHPEGETAKELGYGSVVKVALALPDGGARTLVVHVPRPDEFGHDRRADRVAAVVLALDDFGAVPRHVRAIDAGVMRAGAVPVSLRDTGEPYLVTEWADGELYADDLRRVARAGVATPRDLARIDVLARYLAELHRGRGGAPAAYVRAIRDLVGDGEGIAGLADSYGDDVPGAPRARIEALEAACLRWRHRLRRRTDRLRRTHGDFHPFNLLFDGEASLVVLDASRGGEGDPADDVAALSINLLFFGLDHRDGWKGGLGVLWERFWTGYLSASEDREVLDVIAPFYAWRALVVASPRWYPHLSSEDRDRILRFAERALEAPRFDPAWGPEAMR